MKFDWLKWLCLLMWIVGWLLIAWFMIVGEEAAQEAFIARAVADIAPLSKNGIQQMKFR